MTEQGYHNGRTATERPHLRNQQSVANQNTLIYLVINLRALQRIKARRTAP